MDHSRFISLVKEFPQVWDRNCPGFRERDHKKIAWDRIGEIMAYPAPNCKDTFKSLREKYIREREKQAMFGEKYLRWQHLESLAFLDPHIVPRKQSLNFGEDLQRAEEYKHSFSNDQFALQLADAANHSDFDKTLISLVKEATPIWDRKSNGYPSKQLKFQLWRTIAETLKKDVNICMTRWKGLREKYIRQRSKYQEGEGKWEFLDDMCFLDTVIQYRRRQGDLDSSYTLHDYKDSFHNDSIDDNSVSSDFVVKSENLGFDVMQDSSYDSGSASSCRKRSASDNVSDCSLEKRERVEEPREKSPEQMFGDLVAAMLAKKAERDKNFAMIEIMKVLTK